MRRMPGEVKFIPGMRVWNIPPSRIQDESNSYETHTRRGQIYTRVWKAQIHTKRIPEEVKFIPESEREIKFLQDACQYQEKSNSYENLEHFIFDPHAY